MFAFSCGMFVLATISYGTLLFGYKLSRHETRHEFLDDTGFGLVIPAMIVGTLSTVLAVIFFVLAAGALFR